MPWVLFAGSCYWLSHLWRQKILSTQLIWGGGDTLMHYCPNLCPKKLAYLTQDVLLIFLSTPLPTSNLLCHLHLVWRGWQQCLSLCLSWPCPPRMCRLALYPPHSHAQHALAILEKTGNDPAKLNSADLTIHLIWHQQHAGLKKKAKLIVLKQIYCHHCFRNGQMPISWSWRMQIRTQLKKWSTYTEGLKNKELILAAHASMLQEEFDKK